MEVPVPWPEAKVSRALAELPAATLVTPARLNPLEEAMLVVKSPTKKPAALESPTLVVTGAA